MRGGENRHYNVLRTHRSFSYTTNIKNYIIFVLVLLDCEVVTGLCQVAWGLATRIVPDRRRPGCLALQALSMLSRIFPPVPYPPLPGGGGGGVPLGGVKNSMGDLEF